MRYRRKIVQHLPFFFLPLRKQALSLVSCRAVWFLIFYLKGKDFSPLSVCPHTAHFKTILHLGQLPEFIPLNGQLRWYNLYASYPCLIAFLCQVPKKPASPTVQALEDVFPNLSYNLSKTKCRC